MIFTNKQKRRLFEASGLDRKLDEEIDTNELQGITPGKGNYSVYMTPKHPNSSDDEVYAVFEDIDEKSAKAIFKDPKKYLKRYFYYEPFFLELMKGSKTISIKKYGKERKSGSELGHVRAAMAR